MTDDYKKRIEEWSSEARNRPVPLHQRSEMDALRDFRLFGSFIDNGVQIMRDLLARAEAAELDRDLSYKARDEESAGLEKITAYVASHLDEVGFGKVGLNSCTVAIEWIEKLRIDRDAANERAKAAERDSDEARKLADWWAERDKSGWLKWHRAFSSPRFPSDDASIANLQRVVAEHAVQRDAIDKLTVDLRIAEDNRELAAEDRDNFLAQVGKWRSAFAMPSESNSEAISRVERELNERAERAVAAERERDAARAELKAEEGCTHQLRQELESERDDVVDLQCNLDAARAELAKLRDVIKQHDLCHDLHGKVDARAFADGCAAEQRRLYGCVPDADELARLREANERLRKMVTKYRDELVAWHADHYDRDINDRDTALFCAYKQTYEAAIRALNGILAAAPKPDSQPSPPTEPDPTPEPAPDVHRYRLCIDRHEFLVPHRPDITIETAIKMAGKDPRTHSLYVRGKPGEMDEWCGDRLWRTLNIAAEDTYFTVPNVINNSTESPLTEPDHHNLRDLVARFSAALLDKLVAAEEKYRHGDAWMANDWADACRWRLREHLEKGDPRDVAAYCAFLWHHGWSTAPLTEPDDGRSAMSKITADDIAAGERDVREGKWVSVKALREEMQTASTSPLAEPERAAVREAVPEVPVHTEPKGFEISTRRKPDLTRLRVAADSLRLTGWGSDSWRWRIDDVVTELARLALERDGGAA